MDGLICRALVDRRRMVAGNATDGQIESLKLALLEDDRHYFAAPLLRHPSLRVA